MLFYNSRKKERKKTYKGVYVFTDYGHNEEGPKVFKEATDSGRWSLQPLENLVNKRLLFIKSKFNGKFTKDIEI